MAALPAPEAAALQDITEINELMAESKRVADDLTRIIETANAPIFGINTAGQVTEWNRMVANITEYSKEEALGKHLVDNFISEQYRDSVRKVLEEALAGQETANFEFPLFTKKYERKIQILMSATPRRGPDGQIIGVIGVGQDITALSAARESADRTADELARLIDSANAPIFGVDQHCHVTEWNQKMSRITGVTREEARTPTHPIRRTQCGGRFRARRGGTGGGMGMIVWGAEGLGLGRDGHEAEQWSGRLLQWPERMSMQGV